nr:hypothetical protein Itr_chr01CG08320 [Ipomoea trifida]GLL27408.1 hypothetical protein Itr_chr05CG15260 [Ipomoea trifida]GLL27409.1 hypothetical protein Itr_chr05CG15270 [Ipomoea trifida]GLL39894.1 hypothetical protein Itr_chr11CG18240 [Ipomoea trifida]GLL39895.1 hypothetical protein Itr_chr11CG18250 [Ipomoea trifida]
MVPTIRFSGQTASIPPSSLNLISLVSLSASSLPLHRSQLQRRRQRLTVTFMAPPAKNNATVKVTVFSPLSAVNSEQLGGSPRPFPDSTVVATGDDEGA